MMVMMILAIVMVDAWVVMAYCCIHSLLRALICDHSLFPSVCFCSPFVVVIVQPLLSGRVCVCVFALLLALTMIVSAHGRSVCCVCCCCYNWRRCRSLFPDNPREPLTRWCPSRTLFSLQKLRCSLDHPLKWCIFTTPNGVRALSYSELEWWWGDESSRYVVRMRNIL